MSYKKDAWSSTWPGDGIIYGYVTESGGDRTCWFYRTEESAIGGAKDEARRGKYVVVVKCLRMFAPDYKELDLTSVADLEEQTSVLDLCEKVEESE